MTPDQLSAIHAACFQVPRPWTAAEFADLIVAPQNILIEAQSGFALGRVIADEAELLTIAVLPHMRRQGTGQALLADMLAVALQRGATVCFLEVSATNESAIALYRRSGFVEVARRRGYYSESGISHDALVMKKPLAQTRGK